MREEPAVAIKWLWHFIGDLRSAQNHFKKVKVWKIVKWKPLNKDPLYELGPKVTVNYTWGNIFT